MAPSDFYDLVLSNNKIIVKLLWISFLPLYYYINIDFLL